jgi:hypothetical protein
MQVSKYGNGCRPPLDTHGCDYLGHNIVLIVKMSAKVFRN